MGNTSVIDVPSPPLRSRAAAAVKDDSPWAERPTVLVVDDERLLRTLLQVGLQREGLRVYLAANGEEACAFYRTHGQAISLVLLDVTMPGLNGFDTASVLRQIDPKVRICFMTGDLSPQVEAEMMADGAASVLHKPFPLTRTARRLAEMAHAFVPAVLT